MEEVREQNDKSSSILKASWIIAVVTVASKLVGFLRDIIVANYYGASLVSDAYFYAYQFPALAVTLLGGIGGPFHSAAVAVFTKIIPNLSEKPPEVAEKLFNTFVTVSFVFFTILTILFFFFAHPIMSLIISDGTPELINLASLHLKIMCPAFIIGGLIGIYYGILVTYKEFILPSLAPIIVSVVIILALLIAGDGDKSGVVLATATIVGALCQLLLQVPKVRQLGYRIKPNFDVVNNAHFKTILELLFPAVLSSTIGQINIYIDMFFASSLREGAWTAIGYANRVFQFPVGILVTAFLVPLFPLFTRLVANKDMEGIRQYFNKGVGLLFFVAVPIVVAICTVGLDGVRLVFERGEFDYSGSLMVFEALLYLSFSILPYVFRDSITRVYYAFDDSKTPFLIATSSIILKCIFNYLFIKILHWQIGGITLSTSLVTLYNATMLGLFISKKVKMAYKDLFVNMLKMIVIGGITAIIALLSVKFIGSVLHTNQQLLEIIRVLSILAEISIVYVSLCYIFKVNYINELLQRISAKFKKV